MPVLSLLTAALGLLSTAVPSKAGPLDWVGRYPRAEASVPTWNRTASSTSTSHVLPSSSVRGTATTPQPERETLTSESPTIAPSLPAMVHSDNGGPNSSLADTTGPLQVIPIESSSIPSAQLPSSTGNVTSSTPGSTPPQLFLTPASTTHTPATFTHIPSTANVTSIPASRGGPVSHVELLTTAVSSPQPAPWSVRQSETSTISTAGPSNSSSAPSTDELPISSMPSTNASLALVSSSSGAAQPSAFREPSSTPKMQLSSTISGISLVSATALPGNSTTTPSASISSLAFIQNTLPGSAPEASQTSSGATTTSWFSVSPSEYTSMTPSTSAHSASSSFLSVSLPAAASPSQTFFYGVPDYRIPTVMTTVIDSTALTASTVPSSVYAGNLANALSMNAVFATLVPGSACSDSQIACIDGGLARCNKGTFAVQDCGVGGQTCYALPMSTMDAVMLGCKDPSLASSILGLGSGGSGTSPSMTLTTMTTMTTMTLTRTATATPTPASQVSTEPEASEPTSQSSDGLGGSSTGQNSSNETESAASASQTFSGVETPAIGQAPGNSLSAASPPESSVSVTAATMASSTYTVSIASQPVGTENAAAWTIRPPNLTSLELIPLPSDYAASTSVQPLPSATATAIAGGSSSSSGDDDDIQGEPMPAGMSTGVDGGGDARATQTVNGTPTVSVYFTVTVTKQSTETETVTVFDPLRSSSFPT